jgi:hypothetical protein
MDGTYAPQSPDLSSFLSSPTKQQQQQQPPPQTTSQSYAPRSPVIPSFNTNNNQPPHLYSYQQHGLGVAAGRHDFAEYGSTASYMPPIPTLPSSNSSFGAFSGPQDSLYFHTEQQQTIKSEDSYEYKPSYDGAGGDDDYIPSPKMSSRGPRSSGPASSKIACAAPAQQQAAPPPPYRNPNPNNIEIKTKFPVARIKRIMQADEEVGKVAQVTPVAVSKALELFMIAMVSGAADKARQKGGKRVTAHHLKMVVQGDEQFDFLNDIVGKVADVQEGAGGNKRKEKVEGSDSEEEKKIKKGKGRRKKSED